MTERIKLFHLLKDDCTFMEKRHLALSKIRIISEIETRNKKFVRITYMGEELNLAIRLKTLKRIL